MHAKLAQSSANLFPYHLEPLLHPRSVAVLGASQDTNKIVGKPVHFLLKHKFGGKIFPVNPKYKDVLGVPCYPALAQVPGEIDTVIIGLPAGGVLGALKECAARGIKSAVVFASGFAEVGSEGAALEKELREFSRQSGLAVCGPNCQGVINLSKGAAVSFTPALERAPLKSGKVAFITQSGALGGSLLSAAQEMGVGFSYWISSGNEAVLESTDYMNAIVREEGTQVLMGYIEGFRDVEKLKSVAREAAEMQKPLVILKVGQSEVGSQAASFHTGAATGSDTFYDALFKQLGVLRPLDIDALFDIGSVVSARRWPRGNRVGILTSSGGAGALLADKCASNGLTVPPLQGRTKEEMVKILPAFGSALNPVDLTAQSSQRVFSGEPDLYKNYLRIMFAAPELDSVIFMLTGAAGQRAVKFAHDIVEVFKETTKPLAVCWVAGNLAQEGYEVLQNAGVPLIKSPGRCARALSALVDYSRFLGIAA